MTRVQNWTIVTLGVAALIIGVLLATGTTTFAQSNTPSSTPSATQGAFHSNEDPAHEAQESTEREAQEDAGFFPGGRNRGSFAPNEDPAHEAQESAEREAEEDAGQAPAASPAPSATN